MNCVKKFGLLASVVVLAATGCAQSQQMIRGQSPVGESDGPIIGSAPGYGETIQHPKKHRDFKVLANHSNHDFGTGNGWYDGKEKYYANHHKHVYDVGGEGCPACNGGMSCPSGGCPHCGCGCDHGCPDHYTTYSYCWPKNLVYPPPVLPAGMVQYPYYTLRGPTDFFMK